MAVCRQLNTQKVQTVVYSLRHRPTQAVLEQRPLSGCLKRRRGRTLWVVGEDVLQLVRRVLVFSQLAESIEIGQSHVGPVWRQVL